jgi:hypothetical protein
VAQSGNGRIHTVVLGASAGDLQATGGTLHLDRGPQGGMTLVQDPDDETRDG